MEFLKWLEFFVTSIKNCNEKCVNDAMSVAPYKLRIGHYNVELVRKIAETILNCDKDELERNFCDYEFIYAHLRFEDWMESGYLPWKATKMQMYLDACNVAERRKQLIAQKDNVKLLHNIRAVQDEPTGNDVLYEKLHMFYLEDAKAYYYYVIGIELAISKMRDAATVEDAEKLLNTLIREWFSNMFVKKHKLCESYKPSDAVNAVLKEKDCDFYGMHAEYLKTTKYVIKKTRTRLRDISEEL